MRSNRAGQWAARVAVAAAAGTLLLMTLPAGATPAGATPTPPAPTHPHQGIPIGVQIGGLGVHLVVPVNLGILGGRRTASTPPPPTTSAPPPTSRTTTTTHRPSPPTRATNPATHVHASHTRPPAATRTRAVVPFVAARPPARPAARHPHQPHHSQHGHRHHAKAAPIRHRDVAAGLLNNPPLEGANVALLLAVIGVFGLGVLGIVLAGGRRAQPGARHRR